MGLALEEISEVKQHRCSTLKAQTIEKANASIEPIFIADHPVLDMLNTQAVSDGSVVDFWQSDDDVLNWLVYIGLIQASHGKSFSGGELLSGARKLREIVRALVEQRKKGLQGKPAALNAFLSKAPSAYVLLWESPENLQIGCLRRQDTPEQILAPLAEAAADFLVQSNFELVRVCEHEDCVLWFFDRTKSHKRRWCSMAVCGNRHKVSEYRKRTKQT